MIEDIISAYVECLHLEHVGRQFHALITFMLVKARIVFRILINKVETILSAIIDQS